MSDASWIAVDWGTSNMRAWAIDPEGNILDRARSDRGMGGLDPAGFEDALLETIGGWLASGTTPIIICGMAGARQGWQETPYSQTPCPPPSIDAATRVETRDKRLDVYILPGVKQVTPPDVMRGEETQIAGFIKANPNWDGILCLPGTHTKWVEISAGEIVSFRTFMTGEIFSLLSKHSVLKHSIADGDFDEATFDTAVADAISKPETLLAGLFAIRAADMIGETDAGGRARLSGLLLGAELAASRPYWLGQQIAIIGNDTLAALYTRALKSQGAEAIATDADALTLAGLAAARQNMKDRS